MMVLPGGEEYEGTFVDGVMHGTGRFTWPVSENRLLIMLCSVNIRILLV